MLLSPNYSMSQNKLIYIETYGCSANQNNSEILAGLLTSSGFQITNNKEIADTVILNTCIVKNKTENKIKRKIQDQSKTKQLTIITGCMPDTDSKNIKQLNPKALLLGTKHLKSIVKTIQDKESTLSILNNSDNTINHNKEKEEKILLPKIPLNNLISITQISEGCLSNCTFCKTKLSKGNLHSYTQEKIIRSIKNDLEAGAKEIHMRISSPPITHSCFYGVSTPTRGQLLAAQKTTKEICSMLEADSLAFLSRSGLASSLKDLEKDRHCYACFSGSYPEEIFQTISREPTDEKGPGYCYSTKV